MMHHLGALAKAAASGPSQPQAPVKFQFGHVHSYPCKDAIHASAQTFGLH